MTAARQLSVAKGRSIPIKVSVDPTPAPTALPPLNSDARRPKTPTSKTAKILAVPKPIRDLKQPVHDWPEAKRRRLMWWLVGGGTAAIIIGWLAVVKLEINSGNGRNIFSETWQLIRSVPWPGTTATSTPAEQEIRDLDKEVFPQFQQSR